VGIQKETVKKGEIYKAEFDGDVFEFAFDDLLISSESMEGFLAASENGLTIVMDTNITPELKAEGETKREYKARTKNIKHPLIEKIFNEIAPKYAERAKELGQGGGYTRIYLNGQRKGDAAETAIIELV
jgi:ribosomal protein L17